LSNNNLCDIMTAPRPWYLVRSTLGALRTILACVLLTTCGTDTMSPGGRMTGELDVTSLMRAPGDLPIPIDQVQLEVRRVPDSTVVSTRTITIDPDRQSDTALRIEFNVPMERDQQDFYVKVNALAGGVLYFVVEQTVTARRNRSITTPPLTPVYVGPGANADDLEISLIDTEIVAGDSVLVTGSAFQNEAIVPGTPIGFISSQPTVLTVRQQGLNQAWLIASPTAPATEVILTVVGPNSLSEDYSLDIIGAAPTGVHFVALSSVNQAGVVNQLATSVPSVRLVDENQVSLSNVPVTFVSAQGGVITDSVVTTGSEGEATLGTWRLGTLAGNYTVTATAAGVTPFQFSAAAAPTALASLVKVSGDAQTAATNTALPLPLVVEARDTFANVLAAGPTVNWTVTDGAVVPTSGALNAQGRTQTDWTLGALQAAPTATATLNGVTTIFTATTTFPNPTIQLAFSGIPGVGIGRTAMVRVSLTAAAPAGGVVVDLANPQSGIATQPATVTIAAGQTADSFLVTGVSAGDAIITGSANGYVSGTLSVNVQLRNLNPSLTVSVPYGQSASLPITIPSPAPAGGITLAVSSSSPTLVGVTTPTVTIAAGATSTSATLQGLLPGVSTITLTNPAYATGTSTATTAASLRMSAGTTSLNASFGQTLPIEFVSNAIAIAAPAPGVTINHEIAVPACVAVAPSPATIATGLTTTSLTFTYAGTATLPCSSRVIFSATNIQPDTINVTVNATPIISANNGTAGAGLMPSISMSLGAANHPGVLFSVISLNPAIAAASFGTGAPAADSVGFNVAAGNTNLLIPIHGISNGVATLVAKAPGFVTDTFTVTVVTPAVEINSLPATTTTFSPNDPFLIRVGIPNVNNTGLTQVQPVRFGLPALTATITSGTPAIARLVTSTNPGAGSVTVAIDPLQSNSPGSIGQGGVEIDPLASGTTTVSAAIPGFTPMTNASVVVTVNAPTITIPTNTVAAGLVSNANSAGLSASNHGGTTVWVRSNNPAMVLVSALPTTVGTDSISFNLLNGDANFGYYLHGTGGQTGSAYVVAYAPGFTPDSALITVPQASYEISGLTTSLTNLAANDPFTVRIGVGSASFLNQLQAIRPGGTPLVATLTNSNGAVADLVTTALTADVVTVSIPVGASTSGGTVATGGVEFDPIGGGTTSVTASIPGLLATTAATGNVTITSTPITVNPVTVGAGLMTGGNGSLGGSSQHGGVTVIVKPLNPAVARIAPDVSTLPSDSLVLSIPDGTQFFGYTIHGIDGVNDSTPIIAYATGFTPDTALIRVPQSGIDISGLPTALNTQASNDLFSARLGIPVGGNTQLSTIQNRRFGAPPVVVTLTNTNASIADLVVAGGPSDQVTVQIAAGTSNSGNTVALGGVEFDPIGPGSTTVTATSPGFVAVGTATIPVTISAPTITVSTSTVGAGLMTTASGGLSSNNHPADSITLTSSQPSVLLLARDQFSPAAASVRIAVAAGATNFNFVVVGVEGQTGAPIVTAQFPGFTDGTATATVRPAALDISGLGTSYTATSLDDAFIVRTGWAATGNGSLGQIQPIRFGGTPLTVTVTSSAAVVGRVKTNADSGATVTVTVPVGQSNSPNGVGGVSFDPLTAGSTTVAAAAGGYITTTAATIPITITTPIITINTVTVGGGLMSGTQTANLSGPVPAGGLNVTVTSANPSLVLVAPNLTTAGTNEVIIPVAAGATSFNYVVAAPFGTTGTANISVSMPGFTGDTKLVTVVQPAFQIASLATTTTVAAANDEFAVQIGIPNGLNTALSSTQQVRWGGTELVVTVNNSNATTAQLTTTAGSAQSRVLPVFVGANTTPTNVAAGGVSFDGLVAGSTTVSASIPGFLVLPSSSQNVTVNP
jgi:hypothetical protein